MRVVSSQLKGEDLEMVISEPHSPPSTTALPLMKLVLLTLLFVGQHLIFTQHVST